MAKKKHPWPTKGIRAFSSAKINRGEKFFHLDSILWSFPVHARAFKEAADMLIDAYEAAPQSPFRDDLFFPVAYLYRHYLEIKLKDLIRLGISGRFFTRSQVKKVLGRHDLLDLWTEVRKLLENNWPGSPPDPLDGIANVIKQFHKADPDGQRLRYEYDKNGKSNRPTKLPKYIGLKTLRKTMEEVDHLLDTNESVMIDQQSNWNGP